MSTKLRIIIGLVLAVTILSQPIVSNALIAFLFAGIIPGTTITLPFWVMSIFLATVGYMAVRWISKDPIYIGDTIYEQKQNKRAARQYVLKKVNKQPQSRSLRGKLLRRRKNGYRVATS